MFSECKNYVSAIMVEKFGHLTDFNHDGGGTNFESDNTDNVDCCKCDIF